MHSFEWLNGVWCSLWQWIFFPQAVPANAYVCGTNQKEVGSRMFRTRGR